MASSGISVVEFLRNSSIYLALLHVLKRFCDGEFNVARSLVGISWSERRINGVRITAEVALIGAQHAPAKELPPFALPRVPARPV